MHLNDDYNIEISLGGRESIFAEKFLVYRGFTEAKNFLYISYPLADAEGKAARPANLREKFLQLFPKLKIEMVNLDILDSLGTEIEYSAVNREISAATAEKLFAPAKKMTGSVTRFENFNKCPFKYFANYGLKLQERREYKVFPADIGDILHKVMKTFGEDLKAENRKWKEVEKAELKERVTKIVDGLTANLNNKILLSTNAGKRQRERIKKVAISSLQRLVEFDKVSEFHPELFEKKFSDLKNKNLVYNLNGVKMELQGTVDRVDFSDNGKYFLIIDYKTGKAYLNLAEIFAGVNLQLLTYLMAAKNLNEVGKRLPAGMLYYFLKYPSKKADDEDSADNSIKKDLLPDGWLLEDKNVIMQIDKTYEFIKVSLKKNGDFDAKSKNNLQSEENFQDLRSYPGISQGTCA